MSSTIRRYFLYRRLTNWPPKVCWSVAMDHAPVTIIGNTSCGSN